MEKIKLKCKVTIIGPLSFYKDIAIDYTKYLGHEKPLGSFFFEISEISDAYIDLLRNLEKFKAFGFVCEITEND